jgi:hypothetical protein
MSSVAPSEAVVIIGSMFGSSVLNCAAAAANDAFDSMMYGLSGEVTAVPVTTRRATIQPYFVSFVGIDITNGSPFASTIAACAQFQVSQAVMTQEWLSGMHGQTLSSSPTAEVAANNRMRMIPSLRVISVFSQSRRLKIVCHFGGSRFGSRVSEGYDSPTPDSRHTAAGSTRAELVLRGRHFAKCGLVRRPALFSILAIAIASQAAFAATFIVPEDRTFARQTGAIVIASPLTSRTERTAEDFVETITTLSIERVIKGTVDDTIDLYEPGGTNADLTVTIAGVPRLRDGGRYLLFLIRTDGRWHIRDLALGSFRFATDITGAEVVVRDEGEVRNPDGSVHPERRRAAEPFVRFLSTLTVGGPASDNYDVPAQPLVPDTAPPLLGRVMPMVSALAFSASSYTFTVSGSSGARWFVFPTAVSFTSLGTEPGAPGGGVTAINMAMASWNNDPNSNVNYVYAGADNGTHTAGLSGSDGANTIAFERNLSAYGVMPFQCSANGYNGTLGIGGVTKTSGTGAGPNNETFAMTAEGDVEMNQGIANCTLLFNSGDFNSAVTHEVGHTLGFRHSDQTRADSSGTPCSSDPSLECADVAIMKSFIPNGLNAALQPWDQHAVAAVYPGSGTQPPPAPTGVNAHATASTQVIISWNAVTGATSYQIFRRAPGGSFTQIGTSSTTSFTDNTAVANTAYLYRVRAVNAGGASSDSASSDSASDLATTVIFTDDPLVARSTRIKAVHLAELRTAVNAVRSLAGIGTTTFTDSASAGVKVKAIHINQLRTALDAALSPLGFATGGYTDALSTGVLIKAVHFQEIRNRVK